MAVNGVEIEVGQRWLSRSGRAGTVSQNTCLNTSDEYPFWFTTDDGNEWSVSPDGLYDLCAIRSKRDLVKRIADVPANEPLTITPPPAVAEVDANAQAAETLQAMGWHFVGNCWVREKPATALGVSDHPLYPVLVEAIEQAMFGKGERHGGNVTPFLEQPWAHYAKMHGRGFLTGQAAKKLEEAASKRSGDAFATEVLGAIVYAGMSVVFERGGVK